MDLNGSIDLSNGSIRSIGILKRKSQYSTLSYYKDRVEVVICLL